VGSLQSLLSTRGHAQRQSGQTLLLVISRSRINGVTSDRLVSITTDIASHSAIHQMSMTDSMMKMRQVTEGLPVPANGAVMLEPGSYHLMFNDLKRPRALLGDACLREGWQDGCHV
jgi:Copper chaperone PCu(A)C